MTIYGNGSMSKSRSSFQYLSAKPRSPRRKEFKPENNGSKGFRRHKLPIYLVQSHCQMVWRILNKALLIERLNR